MPPSETTSEEKRSRSYWGFVLVGAVVLVAAAFIFWPRNERGPGPSLALVWYKTNGWVHSVSGVESSPHVAAVVAVTNTTGETLTLSTLAGSVCCRVLRQTKKSGWKYPAPGALHLSYYAPLSSYAPAPSKLLPGEGFTFEAGIPTGRPCKVGVDYLNDGLSGRIWQKLPPWLTKKLSWASPWRTATTGVIDLSKPQ